MDQTQNNTQNANFSNNSVQINKTHFESREENLYYDGVYDIDPHELYLKLGQVCLIDVRQPDEFNGDLGHIPKAKLMVLDQLQEHLAELPNDQTIVFICRSGGRSAKAAELALRHGIKDIFNLKGGMILWNELHYTTEA